MDELVNMAALKTGGSINIGAGKRVYRPITTRDKEVFPGKDGNVYSFEYQLYIPGAGWGE